jgi:hypothetical protein
MRNLQSAIVLTASTFLGGPAPALAADDFPSVVEEILDGQTDGPLAQMGPAKRRTMTECVIDALAPLARGKKRYVVEGADFEEREQRFGKVVYENHAEWQKKIADACAQIALKDDATFAEGGGD